jgi:deazaflavin-dependent oxidoreductase (nitroreductase family)
MPMPLWWGRINKRVFNPRAVRQGKWQVIHHVGRSSGRPYRTPLEAHRVDDGFLFTLVYGSRSDWVRNVLAAGTARLEIDGDTVDLVAPEVIGAEEAFERLHAGTKRPPRLLRIDEFLTMRRADDPDRR